MYNITIPENSSSNCFDSIIYSLLKYFNFDYEAYNIKYFYTDYYNNTARYISRSNSSADILKKIYNVDLCYKYKNGSNNLFAIISTSLNSIPIGVVIDPYNCYWSPFYQKAHYTHVLLIVDIDYHAKQYICFDVHYNLTGYIRVDFEIINNNFEQYFVIDFKEVSKVKSEVILYRINTLVNNFDNNLDSKKANMLDYFITSNRETLFPEDIKTSIMLINIMWIAEDKKNFQILLRYIEKKIKKNIFTPIYELLLISEQKWVLLKSMLIKYAISGVLKEDTLKNIINSIFDTDALMIEQMKNILGDKV